MAEGLGNSGRSISRNSRPSDPPVREVRVTASVKDPSGLWSLTMELPEVERFMATRWSEFLPPCVATAFLGVALAINSGLVGDEMWKLFHDYVAGALRTEPTPSQKPAADFIERRFRDYYGEYPRTPAGILGVLTDLGLVALREGGDALGIPEVLPTPEERLKLCMADMNQLVIHKARYRDDAGPRVRVTMDQIPAIRRMLNAGWARHLPTGLAYAFMAAAAISHGKCTGRLMWENIEDLWTAQKENPHQLLPPAKAEEVERRFSQEYGQNAPADGMGCVHVLLDLGLLTKTELNGEEYLEVPDPLPTPDKRLALSENEMSILSERLKITI